MYTKYVAALFCVATALLMVAPQAHAQDGVWMRAESENFIVYSRGRERPLRDAVQQLEHFNDLLHEQTGAPRPETPVKVPVYLLRDEVAFRTVWPAVAPSIRGFYTYMPEHVGAYAIYDDMGWEGGAQRILFHEYAHHFMMQYFRAAYPAWYVEGFAEYMSTVQFSRSATLVGRPPDSREVQLVGRSRSELLPTQTMLGDMPTGGEAMSMFYAQSWLMVHYMFSTPERQRAFSTYMRALNTGADPVEAFEAAFGMSADDFRNALSEYMRGTIQYWNYPNRELEESTITITRMPRSADDLLLLNARMLRTRDENAELIDSIVAEAARFPGDAYATRSAAYAELSRNPARARELATPLIEADPQDFEAQYIVGRSYFAEAEAAEDGGEALLAQARRHFVRAFRVNPNHVPTLYYYVRSQREYVLSDEVLDVLVQAHLLAPQVDEIRFNLAIYLLNARRFQDAAAILGPIAYSPHGGETATRARRYLDAARANTMPQW
jgi:tetratricopeptide (TPR) repeat protein